MGTELSIKAAKRLIEFKGFKRTNTLVCPSENGNMQMYLHGNLIAEYSINGLLMVSAGGHSHLSNTTKMRLNCILAELGDSRRIRVKRGVPYIGTASWDGLPVVLKVGQ